MRVKSLAYRTDLFFVREWGEVRDCERYIVARTPSNPSYYWGNFLLYREPPSIRAAAIWRQDFAGAFPSAAHVAFGWDSQERGEPEAFLRDGFDLEEKLVLRTARVSPPPKPNDEITIRALHGDDDWEAACLSQIANRPEQFAAASYAIFRRAQMQNYRKLTMRGLGAWYGAFTGEHLAGNLGLFADGDVARYQAVEVDARFRRRGICGSLVHAAAQDILKRRGVREFVIVADPEYHAAPIYRSLGFAPAETSWGVCKSA